MNPVLIKIHSENSDFQYLETLQRNRVKRHKSGEFYVEGVRAINLALRNRWEVNALIFTREIRMSDWANGVIENSDVKRHYELTPQLLKKLSQKEETSELMALVAMPRDDLSRIPIPADMLVVVLDRLASPGNIGSIIRSCDALGVNGLVITGHSADLYDPETVRATAGSFFSVPTVRMAAHTELIPWLEGLKILRNDLQVVGTSAKVKEPIQDHNFALPTVLLVGNETHGLSQNYRALCNIMVTIPMFGSASSLNVACATSIVLYEISRQRSQLGKKE